MKAFPLGFVLALSLSPFCLSAPAAFAGDISFSEVSSETNLPKVRGHVVRAVRFRDDSGENIVILSQTEAFVTPGTKQEPDSVQPYNKEVHAARYLVRDGEMEKVWQINDATEQCVADITADFIPEALRITDLNDNGIAEVWVDYAVGCIGDVSPNAMKIIMYEGKQKYAMRGHEKIRYDQVKSGEFKMDEAFENSPKSIRTFAASLWKRYADRHQE